MVKILIEEGANPSQAQLEVKVKKRAREVQYCTKSVRLVFVTTRQHLWVSCRILLCLLCTQERNNQIEDNVNGPHNHANTTIVEQEVTAMTQNNTTIRKSTINNAVSSAEKMQQSNVKLTKSDNQMELDLGECYKGSNQTMIINLFILVLR